MTQRYLAFAVFCSLACPLSLEAKELQFVQPGGEPAAATKLYRATSTSIIRSGGGMMAEMGMDMGMGMEDEYGGMDDMMMGMGDEMMGGMSGPAGSKLVVPTFLNGNRVDPAPGSRYALGEDKCDQKGSVGMDDQEVRRIRGEVVFNTSTLAVHSAGVSFIPAGSKFTPTVKLRSRGTVVVSAPEGVDPGAFQVLACWQNGFAYPSLQEFDLGLDSSSAKPKASYDHDWRFHAHFRWFQSASFGEPIMMPPGEVRVTIVPPTFKEKPLGELNSKELFDCLTLAGPSKLIIVPSQTDKTLPNDVQFGVLRSLTLRIPEKQPDALPDWGNESPDVYQLRKFRRSSVGDQPMLDLLPAQALKSRSSLGTFLNRKRDQRANFPAIRMASSADGRKVRFDNLAPGWYLMERIDNEELSEGGSRATNANPIDHWELDEGTLTAILADEKRTGRDPTFELAVSDQGIASFRSNESPQPSGATQASTKRNDEQKRKMVQALRVDIEKTIARLMQHRKRLLDLEAKLGVPTPSNRANNHSTNNGPFGPSPDGPPTPSVDPFGGDDPFGSGSGSTDPFGGPATTDDPFGGTPPSKDPFGGPAATGDPFGGDPFGG